MAVRSELVFEYSADMGNLVESAKCSICGGQMPLPELTMTLSRDRVLWFAQQFLLHKQQRHPSQCLAQPCSIVDSRMVG